MWGGLALYLLVAFVMSYKGEPLYRALWTHGPDLLHMPGPLAYVLGLAAIFVVSVFFTKAAGKLMLKDDAEWGDFVKRGHGFLAGDAFLILFLIGVLVHVIYNKEPLYGIFAVLGPTAFVVLVQAVGARAAKKAAQLEQPAAQRQERPPIQSVVEGIRFDDLADRARRPPYLEDPKSRFAVVRVTHVEGVPEGSAAAAAFDVSWLIEDKDFQLGSRSNDPTPWTAFKDSDLVAAIVAGMYERNVQTVMRGVVSRKLTDLENCLRLMAFLDAAIEFEAGAAAIRTPARCLAERHASAAERALLLIALCAAAEMPAAIWRDASAFGLALRDIPRPPLEPCAEFFDSASGRTWFCFGTASTEGLRIASLPGPRPEAAPSERDEVGL